MTSSTAIQAGTQTRRDQRNAIAASFLGWTFDAFDFFVLTFLLNDIAKAFGKTRPDVALTLTLTLAMRPVGAMIFGVMSDRYGRRLPMMINIVFFAVMSALSGLAPTFGAFLILRMLFGIGMGGQWGVSASLVLESVSPKWRGVFSGFLHQGYSFGNLLAGLAFLTVYPVMLRNYPDYAWPCSSSAACLRSFPFSFWCASRNPRPGKKIARIAAVTGNPSPPSFSAFSIWCCC